MPRKSKIEQLGLGTEIQFLRMDGKLQEEIALIINERHDVSINRRMVSRYLECLNNNDREATIESIKLEINQENAVSELSNQLSEYTNNYNEAMKRCEERAAAVWSRNRIDLLKEMLRVTGLYDKARKEAEREEDVEIRMVMITRCPDCGKEMVE